jgi:hypothetical protein
MNHQEILDALAQNPDSAVVSRDDRKCKALFLALGIINDFIRSDTPNHCVIASSGHKTHWIVGACWSGYPEPKGNGNAVYCLPKSKASEQDFKELMDYVATSNAGYDRQDGVWLRPDDWQKHN